MTSLELEVDRRGKFKSIRVRGSELRKVHELYEAIRQIRGEQMVEILEKHHG